MGKKKKNNLDLSTKAYLIGMVSVRWEMLTNTVLSINSNADLNVVEEIAKRDSVITDMQAKSDSFEVANSSTFETLTDGKPVEEVIENEHPAAEPWIGLSFSLRAENLFLRSEIDSLERQRTALNNLVQTKNDELANVRSSLLFQTARADSLNTIVIAIPSAPPKEKFLFFNLPSRKTSFIVGTIVGVVGYIAFDKAVGGN